MVGFVGLFVDDSKKYFKTFVYNWIFLLPVVRIPEQGSDGDMHRLLWTLRPHRLPFLCTAVSSGAFTSLLPWQRRRPRETNIREKDSNCQRSQAEKNKTEPEDMAEREVVTWGMKKRMWNERRPEGKVQDRDRETGSKVKKDALIIYLNQNWDRLMSDAVDGADTQEPEINSKCPE